MKRIYFLNLALLLLFSFSCVVSINAQQVWGLSVVAWDGENTDFPIVAGLSGTYLDYYAGQYYDPWVNGCFFRTDNNENCISSGQDTGEGYWDDAEVFHPWINSTRDKTYCTYSDHRVWSYYYAVNYGNWWDSYWYSRFSPGPTGNNVPWYGQFAYVYRPRLIRLGWTEVCHTVPPNECENSGLPCPTPTPTPTSTPTPTPTPTPPTVKITDVGFTGDRPIRRFKVAGQPYIEEPDADGTVSTWKSNNDPEYPVAYKTGTNLTLFAKFTITPTLTNSQSAQIRVKKGSVVVTAAPIDVTLTGNTIRVDGISIPFTNLESGQFIKRSEYKFTWQISFDNGTNWKDLSDKTDHKVHWLYDNPPVEANFKPFKRASGEEYQGLFDFALEWTTGKNTKDEPDINKVIQTINSKMAQAITYNPGRPSITDNPLKILNGSQNKEAVCEDNALILRGLLKSIGLPNIKEEYHYGGDVNNGNLKRNYYCPFGGCGGETTDNPLGNRRTMQTKRDRLGCNGPGECINENPSFTYHATVKYTYCPLQTTCTEKQLVSKIYDPSYGIKDAPLDLLTAVKVETGQPPRCVRGEEATALRITRDTFGSSGLANNNDTNKTCSDSLFSIYSPAKLFRFDSFGGSDLAIVSQSTGEWIVQDETGEMINLLSLEYNPAQDSLAPADYDGDGITDPAVWYSSGMFYYRMSSNYYKVSPFYWKTKSADEKAVPGDYDGDKISDIASWKASTGIWTIHRSSDNTDVEIQWGTSGDIPIPGDYDGDGKTDLAIWRTSTGDWWILRSSDGGYSSLHWGATGDIPVQGDYDGDGKTDYAVVRPSNGFWYFLESETGYQYTSYSGPVLSSDDIPVPADYNSDSKTDIAIWFKSTAMWYIVESQTGEIRQEFFGRSEDTPIVSASVFKQ